MTRQKTLTELVQTKFLNGLEDKAVNSQEQPASTENNAQEIFSFAKCTQMHVWITKVSSLTLKYKHNEIIHVATRSVNLHACYYMHLSRTLHVHEYYTHTLYACVHVGLQPFDLYCNRKIFKANFHPTCFSQPVSFICPQIEHQNKCLWYSKIDSKEHNFEEYKLGLMCRIYL